MKSIVYEVSYYGKQAHAAAHPWDGRSAFDALQLAFYAADLMQKHMRGCEARYILTDNGGIPANVVPEFCKGRFMLYAADEAKLDELCSCVKRICDAAELMTDTKAEYVEISDRDM